MDQCAKTHGGLVIEARQSQQDFFLHLLIYENSARIKIRWVLDSKWPLGPLPTAKVVPSPEAGR